MFKRAIQSYTEFIVSESFNRLPISYAAFFLFGGSDIGDDVVVFRVCKFGI
jgi:hypothetical protein